MCGIAGLIGRVDANNRAALKSMSDAMSHRGPDGEGFWDAHADDSGWGVMLAHRRLSIIDLSNAAAQPMIDPVTGNALVQNGEIYNYVDLRSRLSAAGQSFQSTGDTAVMLRALSIDGRKAINTFRGMFAFAFWNVNERSLLIGRDPLGIKPLYIAQNNEPGASWSLAFASEVRAILASGLIGTPKLNSAAAASIVWNGYLVAPNTAVRQIESLLPGELRIYDKRGTETSREAYRTKVAPERGGAIDENELAQVLQESVRVHLVSDVPLGVFLSGGIDSSAVANLAQKTAGDQVNTFTLGFDEAEYSEGAIARRVSEAIGTKHRELVLSEGQFISRLDAALDSLDQPTFDGLNSYYMSHAVREAGFKVALVGSGGDELFGGYTSFRDLPRFMRLTRPVDWCPIACVAPSGGRLHPRCKREAGHSRRRLAGRSCRTCWSTAQIPLRCTSWRTPCSFLPRSADCLAAIQLANLSTGCPPECARGYYPGCARARCSMRSAIWSATCFLVSAFCVTPMPPACRPRSRFVCLWWIVYWWKTWSASPERIDSIP